MGRCAGRLGRELADSAGNSLARRSCGVSRAADLFCVALSRGQAIENGSDAAVTGEHDLAVVQLRIAAHSARSWYVDGAAKRESGTRRSQTRTTLNSV